MKIVAAIACLVWAALPAPAHALPEQVPPPAPESGCEVRDAALIHGARRGHDVALTFDACPTRHVPGFAPRIVAELVNADVPATFFVSGKWAEAHPNDLRTLAGIPLFAIALHGAGITI